MKKRTFVNDIEAINASILEAEKMLKEAMNFCEDDDMEMPAPEMEEEVPMDNEMGMEEEVVLKISGIEKSDYLNIKNNKNN